MLSKDIAIFIIASRRIMINLMACKAGSVCTNYMYVISWRSVALIAFYILDNPTSFLIASIHVYFLPSWSIVF